MPSISHLFEQARLEFKSTSEIANSILPILKAQISTYAISYKNEIDRIEARVKDFESIRDNFIDDYGHPTHQLSLTEFLIDTNDLIGIRLVVYSDTGVTNISEHLKSLLGDVDFEEKLTVRDIDRGAQFGYRAAHINFKFEDEKLLENAQIPSIGIEVQVRTLFSDAWARQSHKLLYKGNTEPSDRAIREFATAAAMLEVIDQKVDFISNSPVEDIRKPVTLELERSQFFISLNKIISGTISEKEAKSFLLEFSSQEAISAEHDAIDKLVKLVKDSWQQYGNIDFKKYGILDDILKVRVAIFAHNETQFSWTIPLHMHNRISLIKSNI